MPMTEILMECEQSDRVVLFVDDNDANIILVAGALGLGGHRVFVAKSGEEALDYANKYLPDLIILDSIMPDMTGLDFCHRLKEQEHTRVIPVVFMTAHADMGKKITAFKSGAVDSISKPLQINEVITRIGAQLELSSLRSDYDRLIAVRTADLEAENIKLQSQLDAYKNNQVNLLSQVRKFRTLIENSSNNVARYDLQCQTIYINSHLERLLGIRLEDIQGSTPKEFWHGVPQIEDYQERIEEVLKTGKSIDFDMALPDKCNGLFHQTIRLVAERDETEQVVGVLAIGHDISKCKTMEEMLHDNQQALLYSERRFRTLAENTPDNIVRYNRKCEVVYVNPNVERLMSRSRDSIIGMSPIEMVSGKEQAEHYQNALQRVITSGRPASIEVEVESPGMEKQIHLVCIVAELRGDREIRGALAIGRDITALKETEQRLADSHMQLQALTHRRETAREEERKHIVRELHDDLGQYLTALSLQVSALQMEFGGMEVRFDEITEQIVTLVDGLKRSVRNLSQRLRPEALEMGLKAALESLVDEMVSQCGLSCVLELHDNTDAIDETCSVVVYRVTQESLTNIVRYAESSHVSISLQQTEKHFVLKVKDNGKGFDPLNIKPISFGLVGMKERLQAIGGELEIISEPEQGTTIIAFVPTLYWMN